MATENITGKPSMAATITAIATLVTAVGGLIYTLRSGNLGAENSKDKVQPAVTVHAQKVEKIMNGTVGKMQAVFTLTFNPNSSTVTGTYYNNAKPRNIYDLRGSISGNNLHLNEYTNGVLSAKCVLEADGRGCYTGTMYNTDGRIFPMQFCE
ncbi:hypothetical protein P0M11_10295 [Kaistella sp. PBT33-4]|uniref:hypothetical protein n=1 Tax=Kaistella sp. PBT33-4 TaxID=3032000 RepID=UPI0023D8902C|nr:hypothetical protein [Kaistella sp. PBT33-4]MDF0720385.1 hypothetical protein [Kaistella sp. PBT33-4]